MELILSAISAGGLVGAANQYACLLIVSIAAKTGIISLSPSTSFMASFWFIGVVAFLWLITLAPSFAPLISPGFGNVINTISNFISSFLVPVSSAILALSAIGVIVNLHPDLEKFLETLKFLNPEGGLSATSYIVAIASAGTATALTGMRGLAKPAVSTATGTAGTVSAPVYTILENTAAVVLMVIAYLLAKLNPWLLVILLSLVAILILLLLGYTVYQLIKIKKGLGRVLDLAQQNPRAGLAVIAEFFLWGSGWFAWKQWGRGVIMLFFLALWGIAFFILQPVIVTLFAFFPPIMPVVGTLTIILLMILFIMVGMFTARSLLKTIDQLLSEEKQNGLPE